MPKRFVRIDKWIEAHERGLNLVAWLIAIVSITGFVIASLD